MNVQNLIDEAVRTGKPVRVTIPIEEKKAVTTSPTDERIARIAAKAAVEAVNTNQGPFGYPGNRHMDLMSFSEKPAGAIREAVTNSIRDNESAPCVTINARIDAEKSIAEIAITTRTSSPTGRFDDPSIDRRVIETSKAEAKEFFGTETVQRAAEFNRPIVRTVSITDL